TDEAGELYDPQRVAHFINKLVFCMFAEDIGLLPERLFSKMVYQSLRRPERFPTHARTLFAAMGEGGEIGFTDVPWFDGGLFADHDVLPLEREEIRALQKAARLDWSDIEPSIFGTLFERGLDPDKRSQLGAHYTDPDKIMKIVEPVVLRPLQAEWQAVKDEIAAIDVKKDKAGSAAAKTKHENERREVYEKFRRRLIAYRVLDPACGSGNFLYLALMTLKDFENVVAIDAEQMGLPRAFPAIGPEVVRGIEINPYAAELARVSIWIGQIQWQMRNGFGVERTPILKPLDQIECRDALLNPDGSEADWPEVDAIIGNPPFLGAKRFLSIFGADYTATVRQAFHDRLPRFIDLVAYWLEKARDRIVQGGAHHAGLVATNSIALGTNRVVVERLVKDCAIVSAWSDEPWVLEGAAVRVSLICFTGKSNGSVSRIELNGSAVERILSDLTPEVPESDFDPATVRRLDENRSIAFIGIQKTGPFEVNGELARQWLAAPRNPDGSANAAVLRPYWNGYDVVRRPRDRWIIDFGSQSRVDDIIQYEAPYAYAEEVIKPVREQNSIAFLRDYWWRFWRPRDDMRRLTRPLPRFLVTPEVAKHRVFRWCPASVGPDKNLIVIARDDDTTFGVLQGRFHELWTLRLCTWLGVGNDPRYTISTVFETFPFPDGLTPDIPAADYVDDPRAQDIAAAARELNEKREAWLNPPDMVDRVPEVVPGYPDRLIPRDETAAKLLKKRTLTNLYNERPAWLDALHKRLDAAVARAYGWPETISDDEALARLFTLNQHRANKS
ncbi:MAG: class I SAM-dependent DNA methyltransferase, partial [Alphaproteobacteria bacterium]|nr:class I SAM-dependent DNA methyltransferase [Alphaproteobacteria bacterium]